MVVFWCILYIYVIKYLCLDNMSELRLTPGTLTWVPKDTYSASALFCMWKLVVNITRFFFCIIIIIMNTPLVNLLELRLTPGTLAWVPEDAYSVMCWLYSIYQSYL